MGTEKEKIVIWDGNRKTQTITGYERKSEEKYCPTHHHNQQWIALLAKIKITHRIKAKSSPTLVPSEGKGKNPLTAGIRLWELSQKGRGQNPTRKEE